MTATGSYAQKLEAPRHPLWRRLFVGEYGMNGFGFSCVCLLAFVVIAAGITALALGVDRAACRQEGATAGVAVKYKAMSDTCFVKIDGGWIPDSAWVHNTGN